MANATHGAWSDRSAMSSATRFARCFNRLRTTMRPEPPKGEAMRLSAFALTLVAYACLAGAQELPDRVGRLSSTDGTVSIYQDPEIGWEEAFVNTPITSENSVWTERGARAEVQVGASVLRLDGATQLDVWRLDDDLLDARVESGSLAVRIRYLQAPERYSIATPHARFELQADARYRIA